MRPFPSTARLLVLVFLSTAIASLAQSAETEPALAHASDDPALAWGPCPDFFPAGCEIAVLHGDPTQENADIFFPRASPKGS